ncbi:MAG: hypothetical protein LBS69_09930 [Prevotellaceae bacterium]|nr:hypothetical protein [Prevotellaceae bacterium]
MKKIKLILISIFLSISPLILAQDGLISMPRMRLGIEAGITSTIGAKTNKHSNLRENRSYYYDDYDYDYNCGFIFDGQTYDMYYFGLNLEYTLIERLTIAAGLRCTFTHSELNSDRDYFLWKTTESGLTTNYVKIRDISQKSIFVGIPLELKFFPNKKDFFIRHYFILGTALNFLVNSKNYISYANDNMKKYSSLISEQAGKPNVFQGYLYVGVGLKIGRMNKAFGNIEIHFPVYMFDNEKLSSFAKSSGTAGIGIRTTLQIPVFKNKKLQYKIDNY